VERIAAVLRRHRRVGLDTSVFIYHIESAPRYAHLAGEVFNALASGAFLGVTSVLTLMELAVRPLQLGRGDIAGEYEFLLLNYPNLTILNQDRSIARRVAELRVRCQR
jgi:predicted nucleic acid-binding protein